MNEAGAPFAGDATGLRGGVVAWAGLRCCVVAGLLPGGVALLPGGVALLLDGLLSGRVPPRFHERFTSRQG